MTVYYVPLGAEEEVVARTPGGNRKMHLLSLSICSLPEASHSLEALDLIHHYPPQTPGTDQNSQVCLFCSRNISVPLVCAWCVFVCVCVYPLHHSSDVRTALVSGGELGEEDRRKGKEAAWQLGKKAAASEGQRTWVVVTAPPFASCGTLSK